MLSPRQALIVIATRQRGTGLNLPPYRGPDQPIKNLWPRLPAIHDLATVTLLFLHFHLIVGRLGPSSLVVGLEMKMGLVSSQDVREYQRKTEGELRGRQNNGRTIQQGLLAVAGTETRDMSRALKCGSRRACPRLSAAHSEGQL